MCNVLYPILCNSFITQIIQFENLWVPNLVWHTDTKPTDHLVLQTINIL